MNEDERKEQEKLAMEIAGRVFAGKVEAPGWGWHVHRTFALLGHKIGIHDRVPIVEYDMDTGMVSPPRVECWICRRNRDG
jgi:hypothetical protein